MLIYKFIDIINIAGALLIERPATIEDGFSQEAPLVYNYGHKAPGLNSVLYNILVNKLAEKVNERMEANKKSMFTQLFVWNIKN